MRETDLEVRTDAWESSAVIALLESSHDGIMAFEAMRGPGGDISDFRWLAVNPRAADLVGRPRSRLMSSTLLSEFPGNADQGLFDAYCEVVETGRPFNTEQHYSHEGLDHWLHISAVPLNDGFAVTFRDITDAKRAEFELVHAANHDPLTGLLNRLGLEQAFSSAGSGEAESGTDVVFFVDLDRFKVVNDAAGHAVGDQLLRAVARRLTSVTRGADHIARFGGDEFVVVIAGLAHDEIERFGERLVRAVRTPIDVAGRTIIPTVSVGAASIQPTPTAMSDALRDADAAMYAAKAAGGNRCARADAATRARAFRRLDIEAELASGLRNGELCAHFQPIVDPRTKTLYGAESLVRWMHPVNGLVQPDEFVPVAEDCGLIVELGRIVLGQSLAHAAAWAAAGTPLRVVAVNASPQELAAPGYAERVLDELGAHGVPPSMFGVEITESAMSAHPAATEATLRTLSEAGVAISVDDFGTGFSAIERLRDLPVHVLKIDRTFVATMERSTQDRRLVAGILSFARSLDLFTVAEGVETERQEAMLVEMGVDFTQGYLYSRPLVPDDFAAAWLGRRAPALSGDTAG